METVRLGRTGLNVSRLCLGTMIFGAQCDEAASVAVLDRAAELGLDFIDVADVYPVPPDPATTGRSEEIVGRWLRGRRDEFVVATKFGNRVGPGPNDVGGSRRHVIAACEASLRRLQTDRIDIYYAHHSDLGAPIEETLEAMDRLVQAGKILYAGLSNFESWQLGLALQAAARGGWSPISVLQPRYSLLWRSTERDLLPLCSAAGIGVVPYNPLAGGLLTGRYERGNPPPGSRFDWGDYGKMYRGRYWSELAFDVVDRVKAIAADLGCTPPQLALAWLLRRPEVDSAIVGASRPAQLDDSVQALALSLDDGVMIALNEASASFR